MTVSVKSEYWVENFTTVTFDFLECETYFARSEADMTIQTGTYSEELTFIYGVDTSLTIAWDKFSYTTIPCLVPLYEVTCTGPDGLAFRVNLDGTYEYFGNFLSMCSFFNYNFEDEITLESITIEGTNLENNFKGDYTFEIVGSSSVHDG